MNSQWPGSGQQFDAHVSNAKLDLTAKIAAKEDPEADQAVLAAQIAKVSAGMQALLRSGLNEDAVVILLHHETRVAQRDIKRILSGLGDLARRYTTLGKKP